MSRPDLKDTYLQDLRKKLCELSSKLASCVEVLQQNALLTHEHVDAAIEEEAAERCFDYDADDVAAEARSLRERIETVKSAKVVVFEQALVRVDACIEGLDGIEAKAVGAGDGAEAEAQAEAGAAAGLDLNLDLDLDLIRDAEALLAAPQEPTMLVFVRARVKCAWCRKAPLRLLHRMNCTCTWIKRGALLGWISSSLLAADVIVRVEWPSLALFARVKHAPADERDAARWLQDAASGFEVCADKVDTLACRMSRKVSQFSTVRAHPEDAKDAKGAGNGRDGELAFRWSPALEGEGEGAGEGDGYALERLCVKLWGESVELDTSGVPREYASCESGDACHIDSLMPGDIDLVCSQTGKGRKECKEALASERGDLVNAIILLSPGLP